jgi:Protein of unknown function (DUF2723)
MSLDNVMEMQEVVDERTEWSVVLLAPLLVAIALWSVPRAVQAGDAGEFATVMLTGGIPHPSGYPWMRALGLLARGLWALGVPPATAAALPAAMCGVAGWLLVHRICVRLGHAWIGAFVVLLGATSPIAVLHVNDSEVWGPHLFLSASFLHAAIHTSARPRAFLLGILLGLALSQHLTAVLLLPLAVTAALPIDRPIDRTIDRTYASALLRNGSLGIAGGMLGLVPYASLAIGHGGTWRWGATETFGGLIDHVLRRDFGTFSLSLHEEPVALTDSLSRALTSIGEVLSAGLISAAWFGAVALIGVLLLAGLWLRAHRGRVGTAVAIGWALSVGASALVFPAIGNIDPTSSFGAWILERFDLLTILLLVVPTTLAIAWVVERVAALLESRERVFAAGGWLIAAAMLLAQLGSVHERGRPATERGVELAAIDLVSTPDPDAPAIPSAGEVPVRAIVFGTDDHRSFPVLYVQEVLGAGQHTLYVDAELLGYPWYRARLRERVPSLPDVDKPLAMIGEIWRDPALAHVPIYLANVFSRPAAKLDKLPEGMLWRVVPATPTSFAADDWTHDRILARHLAACARMQISPSDFGGLEHPRGHPWSADLWFAYVDTAQQLLVGLTRAGRSGEDIALVRDALERRTGARR